MYKNSHAMDRANNALYLIFALACTHVGQSSSLFGGSMSANKPADTIELLKAVFTFTLSSDEGRPNFKFWFGVLKRTFLPLLYPVSFPEVKNGKLRRIHLVFFTFPYF